LQDGIFERGGGGEKTIQMNAFVSFPAPIKTLTGKSLPVGSAGTCFIAFA
jgi:hypothetical protein